MHIKANMPLVGTLTRLIVTGLLVCGIVSCTPGVIIPQKVRIFEKKNLINFYKTGRLLIIPFETPNDSQALGLHAARLFTEKIIAEDYFKKVVYIESIPGINRLDLQSRRIQKAVMHAREMDANLLLFGTITAYNPNSAIDSSVIVEVKLINVGNGEMLWWGRHKALGKKGETFLFWDYYLSPDPPKAKKLLNYSAKKIVSDLTSQKPWLDHKIEDEQVGKKYKELETSTEVFIEEEEYEEAEPAAEEVVVETLREEPAETPEPVPDSSEAETDAPDILDQTLKEFESNN